MRPRHAWALAALIVAAVPGRGGALRSRTAGCGARAVLRRRDASGGSQRPGKSAWGYADKTGKLVVPARYGKTFPFSAGLARVEVDKRLRVIDPTGADVTPAGIDFIGIAAEGLRKPVTLSALRRGRSRAELGRQQG